MSFFRLKKKNTAPKNKDIVVAAVITNTVLSEIYQDILRQNGIRFICKQQGAGGYLKHLIGPATIPDFVYVNYEDYEKAQELYNVYVKTEG